MNHLKLYEGYLSDKMKVIKDKFNKLKKIIDFIEKYNLNPFIISMESNNYQFEYIEKDSNDDYILEYIDYTIRKKEKKEIRQKLIDLPDFIIDELITTCETTRFEVETHLEMGVQNIDIFINILKKHKEPIKFNEWMFSQLVENCLQVEANTFKFQNILFSTHPEAFTAFMDECIDSQERSNEYNFEPLRIAIGIEKKYKKLVDDYKTLKDSEKYNL
jgi:hypothetical protein